MRVVVTGGGTGGHVYPALSVAEALMRSEGESCSFLYIGAEGGMEAGLVRPTGVPFQTVKVGALRGKAPHQFLAGLGRLSWGLVQSWRSLGRFRPQVILATGGYVCVPVVLAGWLRRIPSVVYLPDVEPGWAVRFISRFARRIAVTSCRSEAFLPKGKVVETGYPVRAAFFSVDKATARDSLSLEAELRTLLVLGGSSGAHSINVALEKALPSLLEVCQVIHVAGAADEARFEEVRGRLPEGLRQRYRLFGYLHNLPEAMAAADLAVCRAGASVMGELPAAALPSVLVPYPYAGAHQRHNAEALQEAGAATALDNSELDKLLPVVRCLLENEAQLGKLAENARLLAKPRAAESIAELVRQVGRCGSTS